MMHRDHWRWCRANKIRREALLLLVAIETGPWGAGQYTGLFHLSVFDLMDFTGLTEKEVDCAIDQLKRLGAIFYDRRHQIIFVRGMLYRQSPGFESSENNLIGVSNHVERMPEGSRSVQEFIKAQTNVPELFKLLEGYLEGEVAGEAKGEAKGRPKGTSNRPEDLRLETLRPEDMKTVIAEKSPATTPCVQPSSSNLDSTPDGKVNGSPIGTSSTSTPKCTAKASGKVKPGNGNGAMKGERRPFTGASPKEAALAEVVKLVTTKEIDLYDASCRLRTAGFSHREINEPAVVAMLQKAAN